MQMQTLKNMTTFEELHTMDKNKTTSATLAALGAQVIFGFSFMFTKIAQGFATPMTVIANRYLVALFGLTVVMLITKTKINPGRKFGKLILMSFFQPVLYFIFESYGIRLTNSAFSSVMIAMIPVVCMICGIFMLGEIPSIVQYLFTALSVGGVALMTLSGSREGVVTPLGVLLLAGAVVSSAAYNILSRKLSAEFSVFERTYAMTLIGVITFVGIALVEQHFHPAEILRPLMEPSFFASVFYLGMVSSVIAFLMLNYANTYLPVAKTTVFSNITTVVSVIAGVVFLREPFSKTALLAVVMILVGVWGVQMSRVRKSGE
ncbi:MAG: DMT family transporter [Ruminococcaceae bacterium]|nr:DMT family transporter [Oscillospiraceae bacterium]